MSKSAKLPKMVSVDAWTESWQKYWRKTTLPSYELPTSGATDAERDLLNNTRTVEKERARLKRINFIELLLL